MLPRYRRIVEELFQEKLLSVCVCTETLAAGINLPARSVVLPTLIKGPRGKMKLIEPSSAKQMFGRAGRPQFDDQGYVIALPHEDDVKILRWKEKYDQIDDYSEAAEEEELQWFAETVDELTTTFEYATLSDDAKISYDVWVF